MDRDVTLREAIGKFHRRNNGVTLDTSTPDNSEAFYDCHDVAHVVFNCDTSLRGEGMVKLWTIFGTTLGFINHVKEYSDANAFELFKRYSLRHILANVFKVIVVAPVVIARAHKMNKKWPWASHETYLDVSIQDIRKEFNIDPITS